jgi:L-rhamnonate dehydratase
MNVNRRKFLNMATVLSAAPLIPAMAKPVSITDKKPVIADIEFWQLNGVRKASEGFVGWIQSKASQVYPSNRPNPATWKEEKGEQNYSALYIKIVCNDGTEGIYGPVDDEPAVAIERQIKSYLIGKDPLACETIWDQLVRNYRHSRAGHYMMGLSIVDCALWDLRGRYYNAPVYKLLGGPTRTEIEFYASCLGFSVEPEAVERRCKILWDKGYRKQKWFFAYGPGDGGSGLRKSVEMVQVLRETLGEEAELLFDAFMGWDLDFAVAWAKQAEKYRPRFIEEPFMPQQIDLFAKLAQKTSIPVASGEHLYNRWEVFEYLKANAINVVQADPEWCGGVSELVKICHLASAFGLQVIPHGHNLHSALHVIASQSPAVCPYGEYLVNKMDHHLMFEKNHPVVNNGHIKLNDKPGFGIEWDESKIHKKQRVKFT